MTNDDVIKHNEKVDELYNSKFSTFFGKTLSRSQNKFWVLVYHYMCIDLFILPLYVGFSIFYRQAQIDGWTYQLYIVSFLISFILLFGAMIVGSKNQRFMDYSDQYIVTQGDFMYDPKENTYIHIRKASYYRRKYMLTIFKLNPWKVQDVLMDVDLSYLHKNYKYLSDDQKKYLAKNLDVVKVET